MQLMNADPLKGQAVVLGGDQTALQQAAAKPTGEPPAPGASVPAAQPKTMLGILRNGITDDLRAVAQGFARGEKLDGRYALMTIGAAVGSGFLVAKALESLGIRGPLPAAVAGVAGGMVLDFLAVKAEDNAAAQAWFARLERGGDAGSDGTSQDGGGA